MFALCSFFAADIASRFDLKFCLFFSSLCYSIFQTTGILVSSCASTKSTSIFCRWNVIYGIVTVGAALLGFGASIIWLSQTAYIDALAQKTPSYRGRFFGIFTGTYMSSGIAGILITTFVISLFPQKIFYYSMTCISFVASSLFLWLPSVPKKKSLPVQPAHQSGHVIQ